ncbi:MAG: YcaO-like family protein [Vicinamibacterales bacterium]
MPASYRFGSGTSLSLRSLGAGWAEVVWAESGSARFAAEVPSSVAARLLRLGPAFTREQMAEAAGSRRLAGQLLSRLRAHRLLHVTGGDTPSLSERPVYHHVPHGVVTLAYRQGFIDAKPAGFGVSTSARRATAAARGEAFERHALLRPDLARPEPDLRGLRSVSAAHGVLFDFLRDTAPLSSARFPAAVDRVSRSCTTGEGRGLFPGQWIYPDASPASNSNGVASGPTLGRATAAARLELIERDALLRAWYGVLASRPLTPDELARTALRTLRAKAAAVGLDTHWFALGGERTWTVTCVLSGVRAPHLGLGSAARPSLEDAASKAFFEAAGSHLGHVLAHRELGPRVFAGLAARTKTGVPGAVHRSLFETFWAAQPVEAVQELTRRFSRPHVGATHRLTSSRFRWLDLTPRTASHPRVVRVFHPDAAPLPNTMAQVRVLEGLLGVRGDGVPPPIA